MRGQLLNREAHNEAARYEMRSERGTFAADRVFSGCAGGEVAHERGHEVGLRWRLEDYPEFWLAAEAATRRLRAAVGGVTTGAAGGGAATRAVRWLVVSDAPMLKQQAKDTWPNLVVTTSIGPSQPGACERDLRGEQHRAHVLQTVAEMLILAEVPHTHVHARVHANVYAMSMSMLHVHANGHGHFRAPWI